MSYAVQILDAEINAKVSVAVMESADKQSLSDLQRQITEKSGIKVWAKLNENTQTIEVKRLIIG